MHFIKERVFPVCECDVDVVLGFGSAIGPQGEAGKLVPLAQLSETRAALYPDLPTLKEGGVDLALPPNIGIWAPAGTPDDVVATLSAAIEAAATGESFSEFGRNAGVEIDYAGSASFAETLAKEDDFFANLLPTIDF